MILHSLVLFHNTEKIGKVIYGDKTQNYAYFEGVNNWDEP